MSAAKKSSDIQQELKMYTPLAMLFVSFLIVANIVAVKRIELMGCVLPLSIIVYPLTYIIAAAITEVYGFQRARRAIWWAMLCNVFTAVLFQVTVMAVPEPSWFNQAAYEAVLDASARVIVGSLASVLVSEFLNAFIISRMKVRHQGKKFWLRAMLGMGLSEAVNTCVFITVAFYGSMPEMVLFNMGFSYYCFKVLYAAVAIPFLTIITHRLKAYEGVDVYDSAK